MQDNQCDVRSKESSKNEHKQPSTTSDIRPTSSFQHREVDYSNPQPQSYPYNATYNTNDSRYNNIPFTNFNETSPHHWGDGGANQNVPTDSRDPYYHNLYAYQDSNYMSYYPETRTFDNNIYVSLNQQFTSLENSTEEKRRNHVTSLGYHNYTTKSKVKSEQTSKDKDRTKFSEHCSQMYDHHNKALPLFHNLRIGQPPTNSEQDFLSKELFQIEKHKTMSTQTLLIPCKDTKLEYDVLDFKNDCINVQCNSGYYDCQLNILPELHNDFTGTSKAIDSNYLIPPSHMPRGYGGVDILWKKKLVTTLPIGNERIQCIELSGKQKILFISINKVKWNKIDKDRYKNFIEEGIALLNDNPQNPTELDKAFVTLNHTKTKATVVVASKKKIGKKRSCLTTSFKQL
ncbi:unnamed protein product [Mytilus coruscus]|uniref:Uncharacterized protein n=1 Tax=Mytilus coruscus TaxID=42192 RepID=A0A6J8B9S6_MYTCO|nr:unnamed protein product [Mytilus coruscus]